MRERTRVQYQRAQRKVTNYESRDRKISSRPKTKSEINFFDKSVPTTSCSTLSTINDDLINALENIEFNKIRQRIMHITRAKPHLWKICFID